MSERRRRWLLLAAVLLRPPIAAAAQGAPALQAEVAKWSRAVDSLRRLQGADAVLTGATSAAPAPLPRVDDLELVAAGGYRIRTNHSPLPLQAAARDAWALLIGYYGVIGERFTPRSFVVQGIAPDTSDGELDRIAALTVPWDVDRAVLAASLLSLGGVPGADSAAIAWLGTAPRPALSPSADLVGAYDALTLSPFSVGHACIGGSVAACRVTLALDSTADPLEARFPEPEDRRRAVQIMARREVGGTAAALAERCGTGGDDALCARLLREGDAEALPALSDRVSRGPLLATALRLGGHEAFQRLLASAGRPMAERLEATSGVGLDALIAAWRSEMFTARHAARPWSARLGVAGFGWSVLLMLCALWSSRWRAD